MDGYEPKCGRYSVSIVKTHHMQKKSIKYLFHGHFLRKLSLELILQLWKHLGTLGKQNLNWKCIKCLKIRNGIGNMVYKKRLRKNWPVCVLCTMLCIPVLDLPNTATPLHYDHAFFFSPTSPLPQSKWFVHTMFSWCCAYQEFLSTAVSFNFIF